ncbi:uncharacterized protein L203_102619 [Cryptococcus depauperatus CBS 7841]|uniref:Uncharacterized protein n=1 Tax=Cryptococcus depauperatus CBS 7841 TaxID=1295531 RepID=A0A1E3IFP8_9TREE|nr:hypothetical protein L203_03984 [Cryptococcus depauperatus CBS 7841]
MTLPTDILRRPSPWHDIAHSLSTTPLLPSRRGSVSSFCIPTPPSSDPATPPTLSSSQALREWEERLCNPSSDATRHQLVRAKRLPTPKLAAERDKAGFIEYKLKLIDPTPERFEKLVTQMMWRLKQGNNEAIYELGLADDGTVIGLTRVEMDASLHTLELMASEVGATVIVLKEIVLYSSACKAQVDSIAYEPSKVVRQLHMSTDSWHVPRPDLDKDGNPRRSMNEDRRKNRRERKKKKKEKHHQLDGSEQRLDSNSNARSATSDNDSSFAFDMDDIPPLSALTLPSTPVSTKIELLIKKSEKKRRKSIAKQERRRLDLLRGDGTNAIWTGMTGASHSKIALPHQPTRPSSLRLATPAQPSNEFFDDLLHIPLDSLSLSFASVCTVSSESSQAQSPVTPASNQTGPDVASPLFDTALAPSQVAIQPTEKEFICVEALVVRKVQHHEESDDEESEAEQWTYGGEEDMWGLGGED